MAGWPELPDSHTSQTRIGTQITCSHFQVCRRRHAQKVGLSSLRGGVVVKGGLSTAQIHDVWVNDQASQGDLGNGHGALQAAQGSFSFTKLVCYIKSWQHVNLTKLESRLPPPEAPANMVLNLFMAEPIALAAIAISRLKQSG